MLTCFFCLGLVTLKEHGVAAVECQMREERRDLVARAYYLLTCCHWSQNKSANEIYLMEKDLHPRYKDPRLFEISKEFPAWFSTSLRVILTRTGT